MFKTNPLFLISSAFVVCVLVSCRTSPPFVKSAENYNYKYTDDDIACIISFFTQDSLYLPKCDLECVVFSQDSLVVKNTHEKKCFHKKGFTLYKLSNYPDTYNAFSYSYSGKIINIHKIVRGEVMARGFVSGDTVTIQVNKVIDPFW